MQRSTSSGAILLASSLALAPASALAEPEPPPGPTGSSTASAVPAQYVETAPARTSTVGHQTEVGRPERQPDPPPPPEEPALAADTVAATAEAKRKWYASGALELRMLALADADPENDRSLHARVELGYEPFEHATALVRFGAFERFTYAVDRPAVQLKDLQLAFKYEMDFPMDAISLAKKNLELETRAVVYLPTSLASRRQDLYAAPTLGATGKLSPIDGLEVLLDFATQYRFHQYAERAGPDGGMNTQLSLDWYLEGSYALVDREPIGQLVAGASLSTSSAKKYPSREDYESEASGRTVWEQLFGWSAFVAYTPSALPFLWAQVSVEQGGPVLRDGIVNVFLTKREETELVFSVGGKY